MGNVILINSAIILNWNCDNFSLKWFVEFSFTPTTTTAAFFIKLLNNKFSRTKSSKIKLFAREKSFFIICIITAAAAAAQCDTLFLCIILNVALSEYVKKVEKIIQH